MTHWIRKSLVVLVLTLSPHLGAQTLNFDEVCLAPPCAAGSAYAATWGVGVAIPTLPIVAAGTNGLTGTNGGSYLSINVFPYQATISLPRPATFASVDVSRSSLTSAGQTFTLQALSNGAPVGTPQTVTLGAVDTWTNVSVSVPGGFNGLFLDSGAGGVNRTFGVDNLRLAGNCAGFTDVSASDSFCNAAEWLYNRGVTLGCTLGAFCPINNVTRAQMALFMQRLGTALSPTILHDFGTTSADPGIRTTVCSVTHTPTRPTSASAVGTLVAYLPPGTAGYQFFIQVSTNAGATWQNFPGGNNTFATVGLGASASQTLVTPSLALVPGTTYTIAGRTQRFTGAAGDTDFYCYLQVRIDNGNPASAPLDVVPNLTIESPR